MIKYTKVLPILIITFFFNGCNSEDVVLTQLAEPSSQSGVRNEKSKQVVEPSSQTLFFSQVILDVEGQPIAQNGIAFLDVNAKTTIPFTYHIKTARLTRNGNIFFPIKNGMLIIKNTNINQNDFYAVNTKTSLSKLVFSTSESILQSVHPNNEATLISWIDQTGRLNLYSRFTEKSEVINIDSFVTTQAELNATGSEALVSGLLGGKKMFLTISTSNAAESTTPVEGENPKWNNNQNQIAYRLASNGKFKLMVFDKIKNESNVVLDSDQFIPEFSWKNEHELSYVVVDSIGMATLRLLDIQAGLDSEVVQLGIRYLNYERVRQQNLACPVWLDSQNTVFVSDYQNDQYSIYKIHFDGKSWVKRIFAQGKEKTNHLVCPVKSQAGL